MNEPNFLEIRFFLLAEQNLFMMQKLSRVQWSILKLRHFYDFIDEHVMLN